MQGFTSVAQLIKAMILKVLNKAFKQNWSAAGLEFVSCNPDLKLYGLSLERILKALPLEVIVMEPQNVQPPLLLGPKTKIHKARSSQQWPETE